jgi:ribosomal-protein-alanine N-acetyltransferase
VTELPVIQTERLIIRPYKLTDAKGLQRLIGEYIVADTLLNVPHPYEDGMAEEWISKQKSLFEQGSNLNIVITHNKQGYLIGGIGLNLHKEHDNAELGYWIGKPYWGNGYCTEAARAVLKYGFEIIGLNRIYAFHYARNPASGRVMQKIGMKHEGCSRQNIKKWGKFEDSVNYGILRSEYLSTNA